MQLRKKDHEAKDDELRRAQDAEAAQARLVAMNDVSWKQEGLRYVVCLTVHNDSATAVRDVAVEVLNPDGKGMLPRSTQKPSGKARGSEALDRVDRLQANESVQPRFHPQAPISGHLALAHEVWVSFTDAAGHRWSTNGYGPPERQFQT